MNTIYSIQYNHKATIYCILMQKSVIPLAFGKDEVPGSNPGNSSTKTPISWGFLLYMTTIYSAGKNGKK